MTKISVVIPVFNEIDNVDDLVSRLGEALSSLDFEAILVDDGSSDGTGVRLAELATTREWLKPIYLARNYGQSTAMQAGFDAAQGEVIVTLDGDLQNDPADIPRLLEMLENDPGVDILSGWRKNRQDATLKRKLPSRIANGLISKVTGVELHDYGCSLKVYRREALANVRLYGELHRFVPALAHQFGARVKEVVVSHHARRRGTSKYGIDRTLRVILDLLLVQFMLRYVQRPIQFFGGAGAVLLAGGGGILAYLLAVKLGGADIGGRPLLLGGAMLALMGVQLVGMGLLGEILVRIYHEPHGRSQYLTRDTPRPPAK
ncbi:MAG: glycosyltransferase family 2 protein [Candidatus Nitricoxidivorans perseverans]|uniref:Glycosyltransferase family 2 protein n=1 Tax=Candidatus Nitricoxidivorans perseverans TaxID=2975601 RepID=A0AA49IXY6_9PROT|nr:MAG: glycosyltransferase family 2 protein [Candidatus Nitricoxidivorans perseverans]